MAPPFITTCTVLCPLDQRALFQQWARAAHQCPQMDIIHVHGSTSPCGRNFRIALVPSVLYKYNCIFSSGWNQFGDISHHLRGSVDMSGPWKGPWVFIRTFIRQLMVLSLADSFSALVTMVVVQIISFEINLFTNSSERIWGAKIKKICHIVSAILNVIDFSMLHRLY